MAIDLQIRFDTSDFDDIIPLIKGNWEASGIDIPLELEDIRASYQAMASVGTLVVITARDFGEAVGYCVGVVTPHLLNHQCRFVNVSGMYVAKSHQRGSTAGRMVKAMRDFANHNNLDHIMWHAPAGSEFEGALTKRYKRVNSYFMEKL